MAQCSYCEREMNDGTGCRPMKLRFTPFYTTGAFRGRLNVSAQIEYDPILCGEEQRFTSIRGKHGVPEDFPPDWTCDCGTRKGGVHHPGCDWEECPRCHLQFLGCSCYDKGKWTLRPLDESPAIEKAD